MASSLNDPISPVSMLSYHAILVADEIRTRAFIDAVAKHVRPGSRVLDVGTGSGVLAVAAAKLGAEVTAVERTDMIEFAKKLAAANACDIRFIEKDVAELAADEIAPVDIVVSEMIGNLLFDEALISVMASAKRFLKPGGVMIPEHAAMHAGLASSASMTGAAAFWNVPRHGIDFAVFSEHAANSMYHDHARNAALLGVGSALGEIDLRSASIETFDGSAMLTAATSGKVNSVLLWWSSRLTEGIELTMDPAKEWPNQHWYRTLLPVAEFEAVAGESYSFALHYDARAGMQVWTWVLNGESRSTFFSVPASKERLHRLFEKC